MIANLVIMLFLEGLFFMALITPASMAKGVMKIEYDELTTKEKCLCKIPLFNLYLVEKTYFGKMGIVTYSTVAVIVSATLRISLSLLLASVGVVQLVSFILLSIALVIFLIANMWIVFAILKDSDTMALSKVILMSLIFPFGQYHIGAFLPSAMKNLLKQEATFK